MNWYFVGQRDSELLRSKRVLQSMFGAVVLCGALSFVLAGASVASAAATTCGPNQTISNQTINGSLFVPANLPGGNYGGGCNLKNVTVTGSVSVASGGELDADSSSGHTTINGSLTASNAFDVDLYHLTVNGATMINGGTPNGGISASNFRSSLTIENLSFGTPSNFFNVDTSSVGGNLTVVNNATRIEVGGNRVQGTATINGNTGGTKGSGINKNTISGGLFCAGNNLPFTGFGNTASGGKHGQCSTF